MAGSTSRQSASAAASEQVELVGVERERVGLGEEAAVEAAELGFKRGGEAARVHRRPQVFERVREHVQVVAVLREQAGERALGDEAGVLGEHGEEAPREEAEDGVGRGARGLEAGRQLGERGGELARDGGLAAGRVERLGVGPGEAKPLADLGPTQVIERDAVGPVVGERDVALGVAEVCVEVEAVADVAGDDERRDGLGVGVVGARGREVEVAGVALGLALGGCERPVPGGRAALAVACRARLPLALGPGRVLGVDALLGFQDEAAALVEVDAPGAGVGGVLEVDGPLEHVAVMRRVFGGGLGTWARRGAPPAR